jgi:hypothetical protein
MTIIGIIKVEVSKIIKCNYFFKIIYLVNKLIHIQIKFFMKYFSFIQILHEKKLIVVY